MRNVVLSVLVAASALASGCGDYEVERPTVESGTKVKITTVVNNIDGYVEIFDFKYQDDRIVIAKVANAYGVSSVDITDRVRTPEKAR